MPRQFSYEIVQRQIGEHRPGYLALLIDGVDADVTVDPAQFQEKSLREAAKLQGADWSAFKAAVDPLSPQFGKVPTIDAARLAADSGKLNLEFASRALLRRVERLKRGLPIDPKGRGWTAGTSAELAATKRFDEEKSVETWLNRGHLCGLDKAQRAARAKRRLEKQDCQADWIERRKKLIAECEAELARWEQKLADWTRERDAMPPERAKLLLPPKAAAMVPAIKDRLRGLRVGIVAATHGFQSAYAQYMTEGVQLATDDIRIWPLMTNTTIDTVRDGIDTFSEATADEFDGSGYSSGGLALDSQAVAEDDANDRAEFDAADEVVSSLAAGTRSIQGVALGLFNTNTAGSRVLHWLEFASNKTPDGSDFTFVMNAEGLLNMQDG